jgi:hypothetical protein
MLREADVISLSVAVDVPSVTALEDEGGVEGCRDEAKSFCNIDMIQLLVDLVLMEDQVSGMTNGRESTVVNDLENDV